MSTNNPWGQQPGTSFPTPPQPTWQAPTPPQPPAWPTAPAPQTGPQPTWQTPTYPYQPAAFGYAPPAPQPSTNMPKASPFAWITLFIGILALVCSFLPYYQLRVSINATMFDVPISSTTTQAFNAWFGVFGWLGAVLTLAAGILAAIKGLSHVPGRTLPAVAAIAAAAGLGCTAVALFVYPPIANTDLSGYGIDISTLLTIDRGYAIGYWLSLACAVCCLISAILLLITDRGAKNTNSAYEAPAYDQPTSLVTTASTQAQAAYAPPTNPGANASSVYAPPAAPSNTTPPTAQQYAPPTNPYASY